MKKNLQIVITKSIELFNRYIKEEVLSKQDGSVEKYDLDDDDPKNIATGVLTSSIFSANKIAVVRISRKNSLKKVEALVNFIGEPPSSIYVFLVFIGEEPDEKLLKFLKTKKLSIKNLDLIYKDVRRDIKSFLQSKKVKITKEAFDLLQNLSKNYDSLINTLEELYFLKRNENNKKITIEDVKLFVRIPEDFDLYKLVDDIILGNKKKIIKGIEILLNNDETLTSKLIWFLNKNLKALLFMKKGEDIEKIQKELNLHPFTLKRLTAISRRTEAERIKKLLTNLPNIDKKIKYYVKKSALNSQDALLSEIL